MASPGHRNLRVGRASLPGQVYFVTTVAANRRPLFAEWSVASAACREIGDRRTWGDAHAICWVLMPDHWHGLVQLGAREALPVVVNRFKACVTKALRVLDDGIGTVWSRAFHDHALRSDETLVDVARYIVMNPLRAGIARRVGEYPYWDAVWL